MGHLVRPELPLLPRRILSPLLLTAIHPTRTCIMSSTSGPAYLRTLPAVRERCSKIYALAKQGELEHFDLHEDRLPAVVDYCANIIAVRTTSGAM